MTVKRWIEFLIFLVFVTTSRLAGATIVSVSPTPTLTIPAAMVGSSAQATETISSDGSGDVVDVAITTTCSGTGTGTFSFVTANTGLMLNGATNSTTVDIRYTPTTRGTKSCTVNVLDTGTPTLRASFTVSGTGVAPELSVTSPATPFTFAPTRYNDAATIHSRTQTLAIKNNSTDTGQDLSVTDISFNGGTFGDYALTGPNLPATIAPGATSNWTITFDPVAVGFGSTTLQIASNDPVTPTTNVALNGDGGTGIIGVSDIPFGTVTQGTSSAISNIVVANVADSFNDPRGPLAVTKADFTTTNGAGWFKFKQAGCVGAVADSTTTCTLAMSLTTATANVPVICAPPANASGTQTAQVTFTSDTDNASDSIATVSCTAGRADVMVLPPSDPVAYGNQLINTTSASQSIMISNVSTTGTTLNYSVAIVSPGQFAIATGCVTGCTLDAGFSTAVTVTFKPTTTGYKSAVLRVTPTNDPDTAFVDVGLNGTGVAPATTVCIGDGTTCTPAPMAFGSLDVGVTSTAQTLTVTNSGTYELTLTSAFLQTGAADYVTTGTIGSPIGSPITLQPAEKATWTIACKPSAMGSRPGTFRVVSNHNNVPGTISDTALSCNGLQGILTMVAPPITPSSWNFGGVREFDVVTQVFTLRNAGNTPVTNISKAFTGVGTGYSITSPSFPIASLAGNTSVSVTVQFAPLSGTDGGPSTVTFAGVWGGANNPTSTDLALDGDGLVTGYDTSPSAPNALDFGDVRFDQTKTLPVMVVNTAGTQVKIDGLTIVPGATTQTGEFTISSCFHVGVGAVPCPTMAAPFISNGVNDRLQLNVVCDPNNRVAALDGMLTVSSDLMTANPDRQVPLKCNSNTAVLAVAPGMAIDFGATDLDAVPVSVTKTITLTNTGTALLDLGAGTPAGSRFAFSAVPATAVSPGGTYDVTVTYTPLIERPSNQPDTGSLIIPITGMLGLTSLTITVSGFGADRHIGVAPAPAFPDTFKNPGTQAPIRPVTITNNGDAVLNVSAVMLTNDPIWTIVNPEPVSVPGRASYDFNVKFAPVVAGKAPTGHMVIVNNDNGMPMVSIDLDANGLDRQIGFGPPVIDLGYVGIGLTARLSEISPNDLLGVSNGSDFNFRITSITTNNGVFEIQDAQGNSVSSVDLPLVARSTQLFDVVFTPNHEGDFEAQAALYLEGADSSEQSVVLRGRGLYVDVGGGGGCSTGRSSGGVMVLVIAALICARRRRRSLIAMSSIAFAASASADPNRDFTVTVFDPTPETSGNAFQVQSADVGNNGDYVVYALSSYANNLFVLGTVQNDASPVRHRTMISLGGAYAFGDRWEAGAHLPLMVQSGDSIGNMMQFSDVPGEGALLGDAVLHGKLHVGAASGLGGDLSTGFGASLTLPTHTNGEFAGTDLPTGRVLFLASLARPRLQASVNAGGIIRQKQRYSSLTQRSGATWGVAASYRLLDAMWVGGDVFGDLIPGGASGQPMVGETYGEPRLMNTIEALGGMHYLISPTMTLGLAVGRGVTGGVGSPAIRGVLSLTFTPKATELAPIHPPHAPEPPKDSDADGVKDAVDSCPNEAEDNDLFEDDDGCPDPDNDNDGIVDASDKCPLEAEDADRFQDNDGCPDTDNDADGITDDKDRCPQVAEDKDGFQDSDGCPEPDNDNDGLLDTVDKCPKEAETINGNADDDGCPDKGDPLVVLSPDRIEVLENIQFSGGAKIARSSHNVLGQIGATLRAHPEIKRVRLTAHVQPTSNTARDQQLSETRAKAVREWLVDWGIDPLRLQSSGFGGTKPLVPATSRGAQEINDRLELIILERK